MSLLNKKMTESAQWTIYQITAKLGVPPLFTKEWLDFVQANWEKGGNSYMWRSNGMDWVEVLNRNDNSITAIDITEL